MARENEPPGHNRLERMGLPGFGKNPRSPRDMPRRYGDVPTPINDQGIDLEAPDFQQQYRSPLGTPSQNVQQNLRPKEPSRTIYALLAASAIAMSSLLANCVQWQKLSESEEMRQSQRERLQDAFYRYDALEEEYQKERTARRSAELTTRLQQADIIRMRQELERVREQYRAKVLEAQRPLPENGDRVSGNSYNGGRVGSRKSTGINNQLGNE